MDRWFVRGAVVVLLGLGLIAIPAAVLDVPDQTEAVVHVDKIGGTQPQVNGDEIANYRNLDSATRSVFDDGRSGMVARVNADADQAVLERLTRQPYVKYSGAFYHVRHYERPDSYSVLGAVSVLLTMLGGLFVGWGGLISLVGSYKPFNSLSALAVPFVVILAIVLSPAEVTGGLAEIPPLAVLMTYPPMAMLFVGGTLVGGGHLFPLLGIVGTIVLAVVVGALVVGAPAVVPFLFTGVLLGGGFPWLLLGWGSRRPT
jgi:hypothetical protein